MGYSTYRRGSPAANSLQAYAQANLPARRYSPALVDIEKKLQTNAKIAKIKKENLTEKFTLESRKNLTEKSARK
jgi:hypothetical protein